MSLKFKWHFAISLRKKFNLSLLIVNRIFVSKWINFRLCKLNDKQSINFNNFLLMLMI